MNPLLSLPPRMSEQDLLDIPMDQIERGISQLSEDVSWAARLGDGQRAHVLAVQCTRLKQLLAWRQAKLDEKNKCPEQAKSQ